MFESQGGHAELSPGPSQDRVSFSDVLPPLDHACVRPCVCMRFSAQWLHPFTLLDPLRSATSPMHAHTPWRMHSRSCLSEQGLHGLAGVRGGLE